MTPPMIDPRYPGLFVVLKDTLEVPPVEIPLVPDDELVGNIVENPEVVCPKDKLEDELADWESGVIPFVGKET